MSPPTTLRSRALLRVNRALATGAHLLEQAHQLLAELPLVAFRDDWARAASVDYFDRARAYGEPELQQAGLFPFEARMLERFFPKPPARLVLHGCGGGRELLVLRRMGYQVEAYEPAPQLAARAEGALGEALLPTNVARLDLQSWAKRPTGPFDAAWLGWSAWAYVLAQRDRLATLRALAAAVPTGPILLSFFRGDAVFDHRETQGLPRALNVAPASRLQRVTRKLLRQRVLRAPPLERGTSWQQGHFCHLTEEWELREEAALAGCEVTFYEQDAARCPHAILRRAKSAEES